MCDLFSDRVLFLMDWANDVYDELDNGLTGFAKLDLAYEIYDETC